MDRATRRMVYYGLLGLLLAGSTIAVFREAPKVLPVIPILVKDGTLSIYFKNIPSDISSNQDTTNNGLLPIALPTSRLTVVSLNVTIDSVMVHKSGGNDSGWQQIPQTPITLDLLKSTSVSLLINSAKIPVENVTMIELHVSNAIAAVPDLTGSIRVEVLVPGGNLKIPLDSGVGVKAQMSTSIVADRPHIVIGGNDKVRLTPELKVDSVSGPE